MGSEEALQQLRDLYEKLKKKVKKRKQEITGEKQRNEAQDSLIQELLSRLQAQETATADLRRTQDSQQTALDQHESRIAALETRPGDSGKGNSGLVERVENLERRADESDSRMTDIEQKHSEHSHQLRQLSDQTNRTEQQCQSLAATTQALSGHVDSLNQSLKVTDQRSLANEEAIEGLKKLIKHLEEELRNKADADAMDQLRGVVSALSSKSGGGAGPAAPMPMLSTKDLNLLKELDRRVTALEDAKQNTGKLGEILQRLDALEHDMTQKASHDDISVLQVQINKLKADLERLERWLRELEDRPMPGGTTGTGTGGDSGNKVDAGKLARLARRVDAIEETLKGLEGLDLGKIHAEIRRLWEAIEELRAALDKLRKDLMAKLRELEEMIGKKVDMSVIADLESNFHSGKLEETIKALTDSMPKRFAEKSETKRALQSLESRIHALLEVSGGIRDGEDAMIARKPLGGWSCLSCEKQLEKLKGRMASYQPWNKLPRRDPADRIARVGPGFSKMLATFQPELLSSRSRQPGQRRHSPQEGDAYDEDQQGDVQLPKVKGHERPFTAAIP